MSTRNAGARAVVEALEVSVGVSEPLTRELVGDLAAACSAVAGDPEAGVLVLRLDGDGPVPGGWPGAADVHLAGKWEQALRRLERLDVCTIAVASGVCGPAALEVLVTADHRIAAPDLVIATGAAEGGLWPGMVLHRLAHQLGVAGARRLALRPQDLPAERLLAAGVLDEVAEDPAAAATDLVKVLAEADPAELAVRRRLLLEAVPVAYEEALGTHLAACDRALRRAARA